MSIQNINVPAGISILSVNTLSTISKVVLLPTSSTNQGRYLLIKDAYGNAQSNNIQISTQGFDRIDGRLTRYPFSSSWGTMSLVADGNISWTVSGFYNGSLTPAAPAGASLYPFTTFTFTNAGATGRFGPTLSQCVSAYATSWASNTAYFNMSNEGIQLWTVPASGSYQITCAGAQGGGRTGVSSGGLGATMQGTFSLTGGVILKLLVGQQGSNGTNQGGGGGGSFVTLNDNTPLICAGGGGGGEYTSITIAAQYKGGTTATTGQFGTRSGNLTAGVGGSNGGGGSNSGVAGTAAGGGGLLTNGADAIPVSGFTNAKGGIAFVNGGTGGISAENSTGVAGAPGFGGGGGADWNYETGSGGGGGYSGGGAAATYGSGGGGGSYNIGTNQTNTGSNRSGMGYITITKL